MDQDEGGGPSNGVILAFVFVVILAIAGYFVVREMIEMAKLQDCASTGRRDC